jgi:heparinase II/III-like protein
VTTLHAGHWLRSIGVLTRTYGWRGLKRRFVHEMRCRFGWFRDRPRRLRYPGLGVRTVTYRPSVGWENMGAADLACIAARGERVVNGWFEAYGHEWRRLPQSTAEWHEHPSTGFKFPLVPWWRVPLMPTGTDIKDVWEPGRFTWVYDLVRAHAASGASIYGRVFHDQLAGWEIANPPFQGPHWACGQEVAIRALAILHAEDGLPLPGDDQSAGDRMARVLCWSGERIADGIGYALSQRNNHGISEAAALIHLAVRLQGVHPDAAHWLTLGSARLEEQICDQFAVDGWYAQHSFTYLRLALEQALYAQRTLRAAGRTLSNAALSRLDAAVELVSSVIDGITGEAPNHGANDGARALPLSTTAYRDFRPLLTLAAVIRAIPLPADLRPDEQVLCWLGKRAPSPAPARRDGIAAGSSGWAVARVGRCMVFLHAGRYSHRPSHLDSLHLDVRIDGQEVIVDPGTYAYNAAPPWNNGLSSGSVHNGPLVDEREPALRGPGFLWLSWPRARLAAAEFHVGVAYLIAERDDVVRREVFVGPDSVRIIDHALPCHGSSMQVTWLLHPNALKTFTVDSGSVERIEAREGDVVGWFSPTYGLRLPSHAIRVCRRATNDRGCRLETIIRPSHAPEAIT